MADSPTREPTALRRFVASLALVDVVMVAGIAGGGVWLAAVHLVGMRHDAAFLLSVLAAVAAFVRLVRTRGTPAAGLDEVDEEVSRGEAP